MPLHAILPKEDLPFVPVSEEIVRSTHRCSNNQGWTTHQILLEAKLNGVSFEGMFDMRPYTVYEGIPHVHTFEFQMCYLAGMDAFVKTLINDDKFKKIGSIDLSELEHSDWGYLGSFEFSSEVIEGE